MSVWAARIEALLAGEGVEARRGPSPDPWPLPAPEPPDLAALYAASDGLSLPDGTTILRRGEIASATAWLKLEYSLDWPEDLVILGEREDLVILLDLDLDGARAGGGVLEAPTDGLSSFQRIALRTVGYLEHRAFGGAAEIAPEIMARDAAARRDLEALRAALSLPMYPGSEGRVAHAELTLGTLLAAAGDAGAALAAFERSVAARVRGAPRGAGELTRGAGWRACAAAAWEAGTAAIAEACAERAGRRG
jgi:hypothetical protein